MTRDAWARYYTRPVVYIYNPKGKCIFAAYMGGKVSTSGSWYTRSGYCNLKTSKLAKGKYKCVVYAAPCYSNGTLVSGWMSWSNLPYDYNYFYIK